MTLLDLVFHLLNFFAPALVLAVLLPGLAWPVFKSRAPLLPWWGQMLVNFLLGAMALLLCLWWLGRDGKMATYAVLVLSVSTSQWLLLRGWRR